MKTQIKNLVKSAVLGVAVLGGAVAMQSFTAHTKVLADDETMWGRTQNGDWVELLNPADQEADCKADVEICKAVYLNGFEPANGSSTEPGFVRIHQDNGYIDLP